MERGRLVRALRAGLLTQLAVTLLLTTVLTAWWASQSEFPGHTHPEGTEDHVHGLQEVGLTGTLAFILSVIIVSNPAVLAALVRVPELIRFAARLRADSARAPPAWFSHSTV